MIYYSQFVVLRNGSVNYLVLNKDKEIPTVQLFDDSGMVKDIESAKEEMVGSIFVLDPFYILNNIQDTYVYSEEDKLYIVDKISFLYLPEYIEKDNNITPIKEIINERNNYKFCERFNVY